VPQRMSFGSDQAGELAKLIAEKTADIVSRRFNMVVPPDVLLLPGNISVPVPLPFFYATAALKPWRWEPGGLRGSARTSVARQP